MPHFTLPAFDKKILILGLVGVFVFYGVLTALGVMKGAPNASSDDDATTPSVTLSLSGKSTPTHGDEHHQADNSHDTVHEKQPHTSPFDAHAASDNSDRPKIAIILKDVGLSQTIQNELSALAAPVTLLLSPYAEVTPDAITNGTREIWLHLPIEGGQGSYDNKGPQALSLSHTTPMNMARFESAINKMPDIAGIALDYDDTALGVFKTTLSGIANETFINGYGFFDMNPTAPPIIETIAHEDHAPYIRANPQSGLDEIKSLAQQTGGALYIVSPYMMDMKSLNQTIISLQKEGFAIVPLSGLITSHVP